MRHNIRYPLLAAALLTLSTGCATFQTDDGVTPPMGTDYIDDRIDENLDQMLDDEFDARIDESIDDQVIEEFDEQFDEDFDEDFDGRVRQRRYRSGRPISQITLLAAARDFTDDPVFGRVDNELALGIEYAQEIQDGLGFEVGAQGSLGLDGGLSGDSDVTGASAELYGGGRYFVKLDSKWRPYVGVGLSAIIAGVDDDEGGQVADDQDFTFGVYAHGGVQYDINESLFLGVDVRGLFATDLNLDTINGDADYFQIGLGLGFRL